MIGSSSPPRSVPTGSLKYVSLGGGLDGGEPNCITHPVSKFDTLAGIAIKYGVEIADIKRLNGLVNDLQMFALKTLQIPLPGRHPPSPIFSNGHETAPWSSSTPPSHDHSDLFDSFPSLKLRSSSERKASPAMSSLQRFYSLRQANQRCAAECCEMTLLKKEVAPYLEDESFAKSSPASNPPAGLHRKSERTVNCLVSENANLISLTLLQEPHSSDSDKYKAKFARLRQKSYTDFTSRTPEKLLMEENTNGSAVVSAVTGKGLALRPKSTSRTASGIDSESGGQEPIPTGLVGSLAADGVNGVRKSSSTSNLNDSENGTLSSIWPTSKWNLKPDFQALSTVTITRPKPTNRRNKAAVD